MHPLHEQKVYWIFSLCEYRLKIFDNTIPLKTQASALLSFFRHLEIHPVYGRLGTNLTTKGLRAIIIFLTQTLKIVTASWKMRNFKHNGYSFSYGIYCILKLVFLTLVLFVYVRALKALWALFPLPSLIKDVPTPYPWTQEPHFSSSQGRQPLHQ